jgi:hypothetical protein
VGEASEFVLDFVRRRAEIESRVCFEQALVLAANSLDCLMLGDNEEATRLGTLAKAEAARAVLFKAISKADTLTAM